MTSSRGNTLLGSVTYDASDRPLSYQVGGPTTRTDTCYGTSSGKASWNSSE